jgi:phosphatidylglycerophosphate synthase
MAASKQLADLITWFRALMAPLLVILGLTAGNKALPAAVWLLIANWTLDSLDGPLARRSGTIRHTWVGDHDLEIDMLFSAGLLGYMVAAGLVGWQLTLIYVLIWLVVFWRLGIIHVLGVIFQAPIYGWFLYESIRELPQSALWMVGWIAAAIIVTWPKTPKVIIPQFLRQVRDLLTSTKRSPE